MVCAESIDDEVGAYKMSENNKKTRAGHMAQAAHCSTVLQLLTPFCGGMLALALLLCIFVFTPITPFSSSEVPSHRTHHHRHHRSTLCFRSRPLWGPIPSPAVGPIRRAAMLALVWPYLASIPGSSSSNCIQGGDFP